MSRPALTFPATGIFYLLQAVILAGCVEGSTGSFLTPDPRSKGLIQDVFGLVSGIGVAIFVVVFCLSIIAALRSRGRRGISAYRKPRGGGNVLVEIMWALVPLTVLILIAYPVWMNSLQGGDQPEGSTEPAEVSHGAAGEAEPPEAEPPGTEQSGAERLETELLGTRRLETEQLGTERLEPAAGGGGPEGAGE